MSLTLINFGVDVISNPRLRETGSRRRRGPKGTPTPTDQAGGDADRQLNEATEGADNVDVDVREVQQ